VTLCFAVAAGGCSKSSQDVKNKDLPNFAKVIFAVGNVKIQDASGSADAKTDALVQAGMTVLTGKKSQCTILIGESSYITIKENSQLLVDSLLKKGGVFEDSSVELKAGRLVVNPKKLLKDESFKVKTPTAVAAVRGTKFVVSSEPGEDVKISVVEGRVEMKPRVSALETQDAKEDGSAGVIIQKKIDAVAVIIGENQSASISGKSSEQLNKTVENTLKEIKESESKGDAAAKKSDQVIQSAALVESVSKTVEKVEISTEQIVKPGVTDDVKELDSVIKEDQKKREEAARLSSSLKISTPVKNSIIKVDGKTIGYGSATVRMESDKAFVVEVIARDFENYRADVTLAKDENRSLDVALVRTKLKDRVEWSNALGAGVKGDVIFYNGLVIASTSNGMLVAMDKSGNSVWRAVLQGGFDATPAISNGRLYAVTKNEVLASVDASNGKTLWTQKISGSLVFGSSPMIADENIVVATSSGKIYSFSPDGKINWSQDIECGIFSTPARNGNTIYIGADNHLLYALNLKKGGIEWKTKLDARVVSSSPVIYNGKIYIGTFKGTLYCVTASRGTIAWSVKTGGSIVATAVCYKDRVYVGSKDAKLYSVLAESGKIEWSLPVDQPVTAGVSILGDEMYAVSGRTVYSVDYASGRVNWSYPLNDIATSIIADGAGIYVGVGGSLVSLRIDLKDIVR